MNREDIIRMAREAGAIHIHQNPKEFAVVGNQTIERFAALVAAASEEQWKHAVINELVCCHIYNAAHDNDPRKALHDAISWNVQVALDPQVSSDAQALIDRGAAAEREAILLMLKGIDQTDSNSPDGWWETSKGAEFGAGVLAAIRARGQA